MTLEGKIETKIAGDLGKVTGWLDGWLAVSCPAYEKLPVYPFI